MNFKNILFALFSSVFLLGSTGLSHSADNRVSKALDKAMKEYVGSSGKGAIAVARKGKLVFTKGYGGMKADERYMIASLSKAITGAAILTLLNSGQLKMNSKVGEVLASVFNRIGKPSDGRLNDVTIRQLVTHRSGLDRFEGLNIAKMRKAFGNDKWENISDEDILKLSLDTKLKFKPGKAFSYSNFGYVLLGLIISEVSGKSYEDYVREKIFAPLGLKNIQSFKPLRHRAASGSWQLNAAEFLKFSQLFTNPNLGIISKNTRKLIFSVQPVKKGKPVKYSFGLALRERSGRYLMWHAGSIVNRDPFDISLATNFRHISNGLSVFVTRQPMNKEARKNFLKAWQKVVR